MNLFIVYLSPDGLFRVCEIINGTIEWGIPCMLSKQTVGNIIIACHI